MRLTARHTLVALVALAGCGGSSSTQQDAGASGNALVGAPCVKNSECQSNQCLTDEVAVGLGLTGVQTNGGYCILFPCDPAKNDADCGEGAHCFDATPYGASMWICLKTCDNGPEECGRADYECFTDEYNIPDGGVPRHGCIPAGLVDWDAGLPDAASAPDATTD
jgi:hypothetical protein